VRSRTSLLHQPPVGFVYSLEQAAKVRRIFDWPQSVE